MRSRTSHQPDTVDSLYDVDPGRLVELDADKKRRGWVSLADRLRCTYVTREETARADARRTKLTRLSGTPA